jgi:hypothetical protein
VDTDCKDSTFECLSNGACIINNCVSKPNNVDCSADAGPCAYSATCQNNRCDVVFLSCPNSCSSHGSCCNGTCTCTFGYISSDCSVGPTTIAFSSNQIVNGQFAAGQKNAFFALYINQMYNSINIALSITGSGVANLYIASGYIPSNSTYGLAGGENNAVSIQHPNTTTPYYITVTQISPPANFSLTITVPTVSAATHLGFIALPIITLFIFVVNLLMKL